MILIGMLDSPYVRRVAVSLKMMGLAFEHRSVSVFRNYDEFRAVNPVVKAPTLVCDDGTVLMDSTLILDYLETIAAPGRGLMPTEPQAGSRRCASSASRWRRPRNACRSYTSATTGPRTSATRHGSRA